MTNLEKLQEKYPSEADILIDSKKKDFNAALARMRAIDAEQPFNQTEYDRLMNVASALFEQIKSSGAKIPELAATRGFPV